MIRAAIFDIDGTLIDSVDIHARAWQLALEHFGHPEPFEKVRHQIGKGGDQLLPVFLSKQELKEKSEAIEKYRGDLFKRDFLHQIKPFPGVRDLFLKLKSAGIRGALASSAKGDEVEYYKKLCKIEDLIEENTSSDDAEKSKPHPDIFQAAIAKLGNIQPHECLVIGDTPYDVIAAKRAGIDSIGMLCGGFSEEELRNSGALAIFRNPIDLLQNFDHSPLVLKKAS